MKKKFVLLFIILSLSLFYGCAGNEVKIDEKQTETKTEVTTLPETTTNQVSANTPSTTQKAESTATTKRSAPKQTTTKARNSNSNSADNKEHSTEHNSSSSGSSSSVHQHSMPIGNMGRWFSSWSELISYYQGIVNSWNSKYENGEITWDEYVANVPGGYECWSCSGCGKWTGNFKSQTVY